MGTKENLKIAEEKKHFLLPWAIRVYTGEQFREIYEPNPEMIEKFGMFGVTNHVFLHNPANNSIIKLTEEDLENIASNALAVIFTGVDNSLDIWAVQWENDFIPELTGEKISSRENFNYKLGPTPENLEYDRRIKEMKKLQKNP